MKKSKKISQNLKVYLFLAIQSKNKANLNSILKKIINNEVDIIIGTQILSKGHNFPHLKTVGILNIDHFLNDFDFRSFEKCFQQIIQVSGRAGRKDQVGNVLIQTFQPEHLVFENCKKYSFKNFMMRRLKEEKNLNTRLFQTLFLL